MKSVYENIKLTLFRTQNPCPLIANDPLLLMASKRLKAQATPDFFSPHFIPQALSQTQFFPMAPK